MSQIFTRFTTLCFCLLVMNGIGSAEASALGQGMEVSAQSVTYNSAATTRNLRLILDQESLIISADGVDVFSHPADSISELTIRGNDLDNTLIVDFAGGNPIPLASLTFDGVNRGTDFDTLEFGGARLTSIINDAQNAHDGSLALHFDGGGVSRIHYVNIEPINAGTATDVIMNLPLGPDRFELVDAGGGDFRVQSIGTLTFETTIFPAPSGSLTFNGAGDDEFVVGVALSLPFDLAVNGPSSSINANIEARSITMVGAVALNANLDFGIGGTTPGSASNEHKQFIVLGTVNILGGNLSLSQRGGFIPSVGDSFVVLENDGGDAVSGTFAGLAEGALVPGGLADMPVSISYAGGDGNDITLTMPTPPPAPVAEPTAVPLFSPLGLLGLTALVMLVAAYGFRIKLGICRNLH